MRLALFAVSCWLAGGNVAGAEPRDPAAAEALFLQGRRAMEQHDPETACAKFAESQRLDPAAGTLLNLAQCEEARGRIASAWTTYREALEQLPAGDARRAFAKKRLGLIEPRLPRLIVRLHPDAPKGARVRRDQVELGSASLGTPLPVNPGAHGLTVEVPGRASGRTSVQLSEGETREVVVTAGPLIAVAVPAAEPPAPAAPQPSAVDRRLTAPTDSPRVPSRRRLFAYATGGVAAASVLGAVVTGAVWLSRKGTIDDECRNKSCTKKGFDAIEGARTVGTVNVVLWGVAAAAGGAATWLWLGDERGATAAALPLPGGAAFAVAGRF